MEKKHIASHTISSKCECKIALFFLINFEYHCIELSPHFTIWRYILFSEILKAEMVSFNFRQFSSYRMIGVFFSLFLGLLKLSSLK